MNQLVLIPPSNLPNVLALVYPKIDAATAYSVGKYKGSDVLQKIAGGHMQLWAIIDEDKDAISGICITEIAVFPQRKIIRFICATGQQAGEWKHLQGEIEEWAVGMGCSGSQAECRPGWGKHLKAEGYTKTHEIWNKDIGSWH